MNRHEIRALRDTPFRIEIRKVSRRRNQLFKQGSSAETAKIPTRSGLLAPRERAGIQECVVLGSSVAEFQVIATTWGFGFWN
jgi:hypothetical protein